MILFSAENLQKPIPDQPGQCNQATRWYIDWNNISNSASLPSIVTSLCSSEPTQMPQMIAKNITNSKLRIQIKVSDHYTKVWLLHVKSNTTLYVCTFLSSFITDQRDEKTFFESAKRNCNLYHITWCRGRFQTLNCWMIKTAFYN